MVEGGGRSGRDGHVIYRHSHTDTKINHVQDLCISYSCSYSGVFGLYKYQYMPGL